MCVRSASTGLCGGQWATAVPTATGRRPRRPATFRRDGGVPRRPGGLPHGWAALLCALALLSAGCGYHVSGHADTIPKTIHTIAVPAFANVTTRYQLARMLPEDITRELIARTHYQIVSDAGAADAVLRGALINFGAYGTTVAPSGQATGVQVIVNVQFTLTDRATGKVLVERKSYEIRERYQVSVNPETYFDESGTAMQRVSRDAARSIVSAILENF